MGVAPPKRVPCPAREWTVIISTSFAQLPARFDVKFEWGKTGEFEEKKSAWLFPGKARRGKFAGRMIFQRGAWNTFYRVSIRPDTDVVAVIT